MRRRLIISRGFAGNTYEELHNWPVHGLFARFGRENLID
jgi:hypothetical protein